MIERFLKLSWRRKLVLAIAVLLAPLLALVQIAYVTGGVFEGGQKFGIVVTSWTVLILAAVFAWRVAK
ncbi:MAG TPA: hypothetical protein VFV70_01930 [Hyphomonadaceae bacterium]|nr:hypothetical protein [Hyphomonadaceae bacterium]